MLLTRSWVYHVIVIRLFLIITNTNGAIEEVKILQPPGNYVMLLIQTLLLQLNKYEFIYHMLSWSNNIKSADKKWNDCILSDFQDVMLKML